MRSAKNILMRMLPIILIVIVSVALSLFIYNRMIAAETEECWDKLDSATQNIADTIELRFSDNVNLLNLVADAVVMRSDLGGRESILPYLQTVRDMSIFDRIDILLPDNTIFMMNGEYKDVEDRIPFEDVLALGEHMSVRYTDKISGREVLYYSKPIYDNGECRGVLMGVIDCVKLASIFPVHMYDGKAEMFLFDRADGKFIIDRWHTELGDLDSIGDRENLPEYEGHDLKLAVTEGNEGQVAFVSDNGKVSYMKYMPVEGFNWEVALMAQESEVFATVDDLKQTLMIAGAVLAILLVILLTWNIVIVIKSVRNEERAREMELNELKIEAKSQFISSVSHDIRTPLNGIVGMLDIIKNHGDDPVRAKNALHNIEVSARYLTNLAEDILELNDVENNKLILTRIPIDLRAFIDEVVTLVTARAAAAGVTCHVDCSDIIHNNVIGSEGHLHRIITNLVTNAIKYNRPGGDVWITVTELGFAGTTDKAGLYRFDIKDNGIGISESFKENLFVAFEQENAGARTKMHGHGLGLSIVKQLVEKLDGTVSVESTKGEGSTFSVTLHLDIDYAADADKTKRGDRPVTLSGARILLVEDNEINTEIANTLLSDAGAKITAAANGKMAVELFENSDRFYYDAILMDIMMPVMDGCEATKVIRRMNRPDAKTVPIIAMTASTFSEDVKRFMEAGMNEHIAKPLNIAAVIETIRKYL